MHGAKSPAKSPGIYSWGRGTETAPIILHYTILYYTVLYYTILYSTRLYDTIRYYTIAPPRAAAPPFSDSGAGCLLLRHAMFHVGF